jgi:hypothetical protein
MCNIAGYIGNLPAAGVLLEMMEKQEGFAGGYYSGIATFHDGKIHHAKVQGDFACLRRETDAEKLPGVVGIAHSRPDLGGDSRWAHPFISYDGKMALLANGHLGYYESFADRQALLNGLAARGVEFQTRAEITDDYTQPLRLPGGQGVHDTELMCHHLAACIEREGDVLSGFANGLVSNPAEIAGLALHVDAPGAILAARFNQPLICGRKKGEVYLASTCLAFPEKLVLTNPQPTSSAAKICLQGAETLPLLVEGAIVAYYEPFAQSHALIYQEIMSGNGKTVQDLKNLTKDLWPADASPQKDLLVYRIVEKLLADGEICCKNVPASGKNSPDLRPCFRFYPAGN